MAPMGRYVVEVKVITAMLVEDWLKVSDRMGKEDACKVAEIYSYDNPTRIYRIRDRHAIPPNQGFLYFIGGHQVFPTYD